MAGPAEPGTWLALCGVAAAIEARGLSGGMTDRHKGSLPRQPGCRLRRRSRAELTDLGRDRRPGVLPVVPDDPVADRRVSVLTLSLQRPGSLESCEICRLAAHPRGAPPGHRLRMWNAIQAISRLDATEMASMPRRRLATRRSAPRR